jgi:hypothetical protein
MRAKSLGVLFLTNVGTGSAAEWRELTFLACRLRFNAESYYTVGSIKSDLQLSDVRNIIAVFTLYIQI